MQVPIDQAFDLMLTGKNVRPSKAKKLGLVDVVINPLGNQLCLFCFLLCHIFQIKRLNLSILHCLTFLHIFIIFCCSYYCNHKIHLYLCTVSQ